MLYCLVGYIIIVWYNQLVHVLMYICVRCVYIHVCMCMCVCVCVCVCVCMCVYVCVCVCVVRMYMHVHVCVCCMYIRVCVSIYTICVYISYGGYNHVCTSMQTCVHACTHVHVRTWSL